MPTSFDLDDYVKPHFDAANREIGFRIGIPILSHEISKQGGFRPKWTDCDQIEVCGLRLESITSKGLAIGFSIRRKQYVDFIGGRQKSGDTNCNAVALVQLFVTPDHRMAVKQPQIVDVNCSSSGIGLEQIMDRMMEGLTLVVSGGKQSTGLFDMLAGVGALGYNLKAILGDPKMITDPIERSILSEQLFPYVRGIWELDEKENEVYLSDIKYDARGIWVIFAYPGGLAETARTILSITESPKSWRLAWQVPPIAMTQLDGSLYAIENKTRALYRVDPNTGSFRSLGQHWAVPPIEMTALGDSLYIIENKTLFRVDPNTGAYRGLGQHWAVGPVAMAALGNSLYIIENKTLFRVDPNTGSYKSLGQHWAVAPIAMTALGDSLYIIENKTLFRVNPNTGSYRSLGQHWAVAPIAMTALGNRLYIIENQALFQVDPDTGSYSNLGRHWAVEPIMTALGNSLYIIENQTLFQVDPSSGSYQKVG